MIRRLLFYILILISSCSKYKQGNDKYSCLDYGLKLLYDMQYSKAHNIIDSCMIKDSITIRGYGIRAYSFAMLNDYENAKNDLESGLLIDSTSETILNNFGLLYYNLGQYDEAKKYFKKSIKYNPNSSSSYSNLAMIMAEKGDYKLALKFHNKAVQIDKHYANVYINRGALYRIIGENKKSLRDLNRAVKLADNKLHKFKSLYFRGLTFKALKKSSMAIEDFSQAIVLVPDDYHCYYQRGMTYCITHDYNKALTDFEFAKKLGMRDNIDTKIEEVRYIINN